VDNPFQHANDENAPLTSRFICTFSLAHTFYLAQAEFLQQGHIVITNLTRPFWTDLLNDTKLASTFANGIGIDPRTDESTVTQWWRKLRRNYGRPSIVDTDVLQGGSKNFEMATKRLRQVADNYMAIGQKYATEEGRMSEQIDR
jgi:glucoamylase